MRLRNRYAEMSDHQLKDLAENLESLTDLARLALREEMERRGIYVQSREVRSSDDSAPCAKDSTPEDPACADEFVTIRRIDFRGEAMVLQGLLESSGIETLLVDALGLPLPSDGHCAIGLQVHKEDVERAMEILGSTIPDEPEPAE